MIQIDIPLPKNCKDCPCAYITEGAYKDICQITKENLIDEKDEFGLSTFNYPKPKWCPLSELKGENKPTFCDRNICLKNEYSNIGCEDCVVMKGENK